MGGEKKKRDERDCRWAETKNQKGRDDTKKRVYFRVKAGKPVPKNMDRQEKMWWLKRIRKTGNSEAGRMERDVKKR